MKEKLYAARIRRRSISILEVPSDMRDSAMALLSESDRLRCERLLSTPAEGDERPTKKDFIEAMTGESL